MHLNSKSVSMRALPSAGFWVAVSLGALLLVVGSTEMVLDFRYYRPDLSKQSFAPLAMIGIGVLVMSLAFLCERPGRLQQGFVIARNSLIGLITLVIALILLLFALGPLR